MKTRADSLIAERTDLRQRLACDFGDRARADRIAVIDRDLKTLARRRIANRARREMIFDLNGHHGQA